MVIELSQIKIATIIAKTTVTDIADREPLLAWMTAWDGVGDGELDPLCAAAASEFDGDAEATDVADGVVEGAALVDVVVEGATLADGVVEGATLDDTLADADVDPDAVFDEVTEGEAPFVMEAVVDAVGETVAEVEGEGEGEAEGEWVADRVADEVADGWTKGLLTVTVLETRLTSKTIETPELRKLTFSNATKLVVSARPAWHWFAAAALATMITVVTEMPPCFDERSPMFLMVTLD
jgi:hypothetical protein